MAYECQNCYSKFEDDELSSNSLGDLQCPECGSFDVEQLEDTDFEYPEFDNPNLDDSETLYGSDGTVDEY